MFISCWRATCAIALALLLGACASLPLEQGRSNVDALVRTRIVPTQSAMASDAQITRWLSEPLTLEAAQNIALLRNPQIRGEFARLGLSAADVFEAGRLQNPTLGLSWLFPLANVDGSKLGASAGFGLADLLLRVPRQRIATAEFQGAQERVAAAVLDLLARTQLAWYQCVAATQRVTVRRSIADAAALGADLAQRYNQAGNLGQLELQMQRAEASQSRIDLHSAELELTDARAQLQQLLGLSAPQADWRIPDALPEPSRQDLVASVNALQSQAMQQRLDLSGARKSVQALQIRRDVVHGYRMVSDARLGAEFERENSDKRLGPSAQLTLPLFQQGQGVAARADADLLRAQAELSELEGDIQAQVARQLQRMELARSQVTAYREGLIPEREAIVARLKEQANFMLVDSFAVLLARQQEYAAYAGYVDALLRYWSAQIELLRATGSLRSLEVQP